MSTIDWSARIRTALRGGDRRAPDDDVVEELAQHAAALFETALAAGIPPADAEARVEVQIARWRADAMALHRAMWRPAAVVPPGPPRSPWGGWRQDLRYAVRLLWRRPRPALTAIATLALGIGAATTLFSVAYGALLRPLPWPNADRVVALRETRSGVPPRFGEVTNAAYLAWQERADTLEALSAWSTRVVTLTGRGEAERVRIVAATPSLFRVLGVRPLAGRVIGPGEEAAGVAMLSERLWRRRFGADPAVVGQAVVLDGQARTVVGILAAGDAFPDAETQAIVPLSIPPASNSQLSLSSALALLRPGVTPAQAAAEATARGRFAPDTGMTTMALFGTNGPIAIAARPLQDALTVDVRRPLILLLIAVALLLATATTNVAGVQLTGFTARTRELAIRGALGAAAGRVARQLLVEASIVALAGGGAGLAVTWLLIDRALPALMPADFPRLDGLRVDATVVAFALAVSAGTSLAVGVLPALRARRLTLVAALAEDGNAPVGAGLRSRAGRARTLVLAAQVAVACVLLVGGSLLGRSFVALVSADRGYDADHVLSARLSMPPSLFPEPPRRAAIVDGILARVAAAPGVRDAAFTSEIPLVPGGSTSAFQMRSGKAGAVTAQASPRIVSPAYFAALRIATVDGRGFGEMDTASSEPVVVVNQAFAARYLPDGAVGARLPIVAYEMPGREGAEATVAGVVENVHYVAHGGVVQPELYFVHRQIPSGLPVQTVTLLVRTSGDPSAAAAALREAVRATDGRLVAEAIQPLEARFLATVARPRFYAALLGGFAAASLAIATVGLFGLVSYAASLRSRELAVRAALGATRGDLLRVVMGQGLAATVAGIAVGLAVSGLAAGLLSTELYGVTPHDPVTFIAVPALLLAVASTACALPARRAARTDPLRLFRDDR
jgi:predicted permease